MPYGVGGAQDADKGGFGSPSPGAASSAAGDTGSSEGEKGKSLPPVPRVFWISHLVNELSSREGLAIPESTIRRHLLITGRRLPQPPSGAA